MVTLSIIDKWADSLPVAWLVNFESSRWFCFSKPHRMCISCWFKGFSYDRTKECRTEQLKPNTTTKKITQSLIHTIWPLMWGLHEQPLILFQSNWQQGNYVMFIHNWKSERIYLIVSVSGFSKPFFKITDRISDFSLMPVLANLVWILNLHCCHVLSKTVTNNTRPALTRRAFLDSNLAQHAWF